MSVLQCLTSETIGTQQIETFETCVFYRGGEAWMF